MILAILLITLDIHYCFVCRVWRVSDHAPLAQCHTPHPVRSLAYSPDGAHLAAGMQDGGFTVFNARSETL